MARKLIVEVIGDSRSLERAFSRSSKATDRFGRDIGQAGRGVVAVSGLFAGLGRQVAFASSAFLGGAGLTKVLTDAIGEASEATKTQRQLAAQFRANGQDLRFYQAEIDATSTRVSRLAGIQDEELTQAFTNAFRGTKDVTAALKVESVAADVARGRTIALSTAGIALTKAYLGQTTALKRLGIQIPANVKGMEALELVGRRFAGQAAAGTTAQERLSVAISETEETIGKVLLPTVTKIANEITKWLNNEENQARIQKDVQEAVRLTTEAFKAFNSVLQVTLDVGGKVAAVFKTLQGLPLGRQGLLDLPGGRQGIIDLLFGGGGSQAGPARTPRVTIGPRQTTSEDIALRGAKARQEQAQKTGRALSLVAKIARAELAVAKALTTKTRADDRAALEVQAQLIREAIASHKKAFRDKEALYRQLAATQDQIQAIDQDARQKQEDAAKKAADAQKKAADKAKAAQEKAAAIAKKQRDQERAARKKAHDIAVRAAKEARDAAKQAAREFRDLIQTERDRIGELFAGPVFNPTEAQRQRALGFRDPGANARTLVADLKAQIQQFKDFERDLQKLAKRGAPPQLLQELRQQGLAVAPQVHALATAGAGTFAQFKSLFIQRERLAVQAAKQARPVVNLTVIVNKDTGHVQVKTTPHGQKRGRNPGVIVNKGHVLQ